MGAAEEGAEDEGPGLGLFLGPRHHPHPAQPRPGPQPLPQEEEAEGLPRRLPHGGGGEELQVGQVEPREEALPVCAGVEDRPVEAGDEALLQAPFGARTRLENRGESPFVLIPQRVQASPF